MHADWTANQGGWINLKINKDFTLIYGGSGISVKGDFGATGNTIMDGDTSTTYFAGSSPTMLNEDSTISNMGTNSYNKNSSSAPLTLPSYVKREHIVWAGLFWQAQIHDNANSTSNVDSLVAGWNTVRLRTPNGTIHTITAPTDSNNASHTTYHYAHLKYGQFRYFYSAYVDITDIVKNQSGYTASNNTFTVGNIMATDGTDNYSQIYFNHINEPDGAWYNLRMGHFGGWSLIVAYDVDPDTMAAHESEIKYRNVSIYNGYDLFSFWTGHAGDVFETTVSLSGFKTPSDGTISSKLLFFGGGGDYGMDHDKLQIEDGNNIGTYIDLTNFRNTGTQKFNGTYTDLDGDIITGKSYFQGMDLDIFDTSSMMAHKQSSTNIKFGVVQQSRYIDQVFPQVLAFSTELYAPKFCYDYAYSQNGRFFTEENNGSYAPTLRGEGLDTGDSSPVKVEIYVRNMENSDINATNLKFNILDINTSQATYVDNSTYVIKPNRVFPEFMDEVDSDLQSYNKDIPIGTVAGEESFYLDYNLSLVESEVNMPLNLTMDYDLVFADMANSIHYQDRQLNQTIPLCTDANFAYTPTYAIFNVEDAGLVDNQIYNLPTQTANRPGDFKVVAYYPDNVNTRKEVSTVVAIELIDAGKYHGIDASCSEPDSALTPRVWVSFGNTQEGNVSMTDFNAASVQKAIDHGVLSNQIIGNDPITSAGEYFRNVRENTAFRISWNNFGDFGGIIHLEAGTCQGNQVPPCYKVLNFPDLSQEDLGNGKGNCIQDIDHNPTNVDKIPQVCGNAGVRGMDSVALAICMECIYGYGFNYSCSRDNFATRPESFRLSMEDQNQTGPTTPPQTPFAINNSNARQEIVAGYKYALEVNATNHENDKATPGYYVTFPEDGEQRQRTFRFAWQTTADDSKCNDHEDHNRTLNVFNGSADINLTADQVGKYDLTLTDKLWTKVDWDTDYMQHHTGDYFLSGKDCIWDQSIVPPTGTITTISGQNLANVSGCMITTRNHTNSDDNNLKYTDIPLRVHPYTFDQSGIIPQSGPYTRSSVKTFIYMDTPSTLEVDNTDMSYNLNGTFFAAGFDGGHLNNYVTGCYAKDVDIDLDYAYSNPNSGPYLYYSLKDINTETSTVIRPIPSSGLELEVPPVPGSEIHPIRITQNENFFAQEMNGSINMDLGYNFKREYNKPVNPIPVNFKNLNMTYSEYNTGSLSNIHADLKNNYKVYGEKTIDQNVTFIYGRTKSSKYFYDDVISNSINTPISVVAYCDQDPVNCSAIYNINSLDFNRTNDYDWYLVLKHQMTPDNDGNITLKATSPDVASSAVSVTSPVVINNTNGVDQNVQVATTATTRPVLVNIDFDTGTNKWLIYNEFNNSIPTPFYKVRFIGNEGWAGHGDTGHVVEHNASKTKNQRLGW